MVLNASDCSYLALLVCLSLLYPAAAQASSETATGFPSCTLLLHWDHTGKGTWAQPWYAAELGCLETAQ